MAANGGRGGAWGLLSDGSGSGTAACFAVRLTGLVMGREALALACVALNCARRSRSADALAGPSVVSVAACEGIGEPFGGAASLVTRLSRAGMMASVLFDFARAVNCCRMARRTSTSAGSSVVSACVEGIGAPFKGAAGLTFATEVRVPRALTLLKGSLVVLSWLVRGSV